MLSAALCDWWLLLLSVRKSNKLRITRHTYSKPYHNQLKFRMQQRNFTLLYHNYRLRKRRVSCNDYSSTRAPVVLYMLQKRGSRLLLVIVWNLMVPNHYPILLMAYSKLSNSKKNPVNCITYQKKICTVVPQSCGSFIVLTQCYKYFRRTWRK